MQVGSVTVKVYTALSRKRGVSYAGYVASFWIDGKRYRIPASSLEVLESKVKDTIRPLIGDNDTLTLRGVRLRAYERATSIATELGLELDEALQRLSRIQSLAASKNCSIEQAVEYWARHHDQSKFSTPTPEVAEAYLLYLLGNGSNGKEDIASVKGRVKRFAAAFTCPLSEITINQYQAYFDCTTGSPRTRKNHRDEVRRFVNWARVHGYLAPDHPGVPRFVGRVKVPPKRVEVFDMCQREDLIKHTLPDERAMTLIKAYIPIRAKEAGLSCWENIDWDVGIIMVWGDEAKMKVPRPIYLPRELCERLRPLAKSSGKIYPYKSFYKVGPRLAKRAGLKWIKNGWRTTVISHLQAAVNSLERVVEEAGTSKLTAKSHYLKPLRPDVGRAYFGLKKGERHPIEPGYNAEQYGVNPDAPAGNDLSEKIVHVKFDAHCG